MIKRIFPLFILFSLVLSSVLAPVAVGSTRAAGPPGLTLVEVDAAGVTVSLVTPKFDLSELTHDGVRFHQLSVPGYEQTRTPGEPALPQLSTLIGVPPGARVWVEVLTTDTRPQRIQFPVEPAPAPAPLEDDLQPGEWFAPTEGASYQADQLYPAQPAAIGADTWIRGQRVVRLSLSPFQYNPAHRELLWHRQLQVRVHFQMNPAAEVPQSCSVGCWDAGPIERLLEHNLLNAAQARAWRSRPAVQTAHLTAGVTDAETRYKIVVDQDGLYRLSYTDLQNAGLDVAGSDPRNFQLTSQGETVVILVPGEGDGSFDPGDSLVFYGEQFKGDHLAQVYADSMEDWTWLCPTVCDLAGILEKYTDENVYWLTVESTPGLRMQTEPGEPAGATIPTYYTTTVHLEEDHAWYSYHFLTEDTWFWERIQPGPAEATRTYTATLDALSASVLTATVRAEAIARSNNEHQTQFFLNGDTQPFDDSTWYGQTQLSVEVDIPHTDLQAGENTLDFKLLDNGALQEIFFDWFEIMYGREFQAAGDQLRFTYENPGTWQFQIAGLDSSAASVLDITHPLTPTLILSATITDAGSTYTAAFEQGLGASAEYLVAGSGAELSPKAIQAYTPEDFLGTADADYIFITHPDLITETQRLADYRAGQGLSTRIVSFTELYNQFNYGIYHPIAIKNFLAYTFANWTTVPTYVNLVGGGHWNLKGVSDYGADQIYMPPNLAFVDPWQGEVDSANLLAAVSGDDIFPDVYIARMPANSPTELGTMIDKILAYEAIPLREWQQHFLFVADDTPDAAGDFVALSEGMIADYLEGESRLTVDRAYLDDHSTSTITQVVLDAINTDGASLVNYIGHGSLNFWAHQILSNDDVPDLDNGSQLPVVLSMTCLDGYWIYPDRPSLVATLLATPGKGAVSTFSATGLGVATGHDFLHRGFYSALFDQGVWELGPAAQNAKLNLFTNGYSDDLVHTFTVFGDPALQIQSPYGAFLPSIRN